MRHSTVDQGNAQVRVGWQTRVCAFLSCYSSLCYSNTPLHASNTHLVSGGWTFEAIGQKQMPKQKEKTL
jgi:hypothetical protein